MTHHTTTLLPDPDFPNTGRAENEHRRYRWPWTGKREAEQALEQSRADRARLDRALAESRHAVDAAWSALVVAELRGVRSDIQKLTKILEGR